ncbi:MAG TPA: tetratricopeptide repeat protein, partial [Candidatus Acidoferrum sp.]|nr:tetratricopeptide repeat protein [Candidatus Acidoferrum sp.]
LHFAARAPFRKLPASVSASALAVLLLSVLSLTACTTTTLPPVAAKTPARTETAQPASPATAEKAPEKDKEPKYGSFTADQLARSIIAELAGQRGQNDVALNEYVALARETGNVSIAQRAMRIAAFSREAPLAIEMAELWLQQEPQAVEPRQTIAVELVGQGRYRDAFRQFATLLDQGESVDFRLLSARIAATSANGTPPALGGLIDDYEALLKRYPTHESLRLSLSHLYQLDKQPKPALALIRQMQKEVEQRDRGGKGAATTGTPDIKGGDLVMLEVQLLDGMDEHAAALKRIEQGIRQYPDHKDLRYLYGRKLVIDKKYPQARDQFAALAQQYPTDTDLLYSVALLSMEINQYADARNYLQRLILNGQRLDDANYYLGYIDAQENHNDLAIDHYMKVRSGSNFLQSLRNLTQLMVRANRYNEVHSYLQNVRFRNADLNITLLAMEGNTLLDEKQFETAKSFLNSSVGAFPNNVELLFLRSVLSQDINDLALMESDLRKIILLEPQSPVAYNSLGYTLADRTDRYQEAYELIKHAYDLSPNDPAIIDSLGWVQYKLGMYHEARDNLDKAYKLFPDAEVAAHLGEVLWKLGEKSAATKLWRSALSTAPDGAYLRSTMQRLDPAAAL